MVFPGSEIIFGLSSSSDFAKLYTDNNLSEKNLTVKIVDSKKAEFDLKVEFVLKTAKGELLVIKTSDSPLNISEGKSELFLLVNDIPKAKIDVSVRPAKLKTTDGNLNVDELSKPVINFIKILRSKDSIKIKIVGENFYRRRAIFNNDLVKTKYRLTDISFLPKDVLKKTKKLRVLKGRKVIIASYKLLDREQIDNTVLIISNPYGQTFKVIEFPRKGKHKLL